MFNTCECGCGLTVGEGSRYYNSAHRQRAYRARKRNQKRALSRYVQQELIGMLGEKEASKCIGYLNGVFGDKQAHEVNKAMMIIIAKFKSGLIA